MELVTSSSTPGPKRGGAEPMQLQPEFLEDSSAFATSNPALFAQSLLFTGRRTARSCGLRYEALGADSGVIGQAVECSFGVGWGYLLVFNLRNVIHYNPH